MVQGWQDQPVSITSSLATEDCWPALGPVELTAQLLVEGEYMGHWPPLPPCASPLCGRGEGWSDFDPSLLEQQRGDIYSSLCAFIFCGLGNISGLGNLFCRPKNKRSESLADCIWS